MSAISIDETTRSSGGEIPCFPKNEERTENDPELDTALVKAAFSLDMKAPLYRRIIKTSDGWNVIRLRGFRKAKAISLADAERTIRHRLYRDRILNIQKELAARLLKEANIERFVENFALVKIIDPTLEDESEAGSETSPAKVPSHIKADAERRELPLAKLSNLMITVGDFEDRFNELGPFRRLEFSGPEKQREFLDQMIDNELQAEEAERRGLGDDTSLLEQMDQVMSNILQRREVDYKILPNDITDEEIREYYDKNSSMFRLPERVRAYHIVLSDRTKAQALLDRLRGGQSDARLFRKLAREQSEDPDTKRRGGDLRFFPHSEDRTERDPDIPEPVVRAAFELVKIRKNHTNAQSTSSNTSVAFDPIYPRLVETKDGFHIILFVGHRDSRLANIEEVERQIRNRILHAKRQEARGRFMEDIEARYPVHIDENAPELIELVWSLLSVPLSSP